MIGSLALHTFKVDALATFHKNARRGDVSAIAESLAAHGQYKPIVVNLGSKTGRPNEVLAGNHTLLGARSLGWSEIQAVTVDVEEAEAARIVAADNRIADLGSYDTDDLRGLLGLAGDLTGTGYSEADLAALFDEPTVKAPTVSLASRFGAAPLSVLSSRGGEWQERKKAWLATGLRSELGRDSGLVFASPHTKYANFYPVKHAAEAEVGHRLDDAEVVRRYGDRLKLAVGGGTSVFDPALSELVYSWFSGEGARVIDPWAGGAVRGVVAGALGREYVGIELRPEQIAANREQLPAVEAAVRAALGDGGSEPEWVEGFAADVLAGLPDESFDMAFSEPPRYPGFLEPTWLEGESRAVLEGVEGESFDLAFGCPPYYSLERYSDDPRDLSTMTPAQFDAAMAANVTEISRVLRPDSFAVFVTGNVRGRDGVILDMRRCMTAAGEAAGLRLINDAILLTPVGSAAARAAKGFKSTRVLARIHQEVLVFVKGDRKAAAIRAGEVDRRDLRDVAVEVTDDEGS